MVETDPVDRALAAELEAARRTVEELEQTVARQQETERALAEDRRFREAVIERAAEGVCVCHDVEDYPFVEFTVWNSRMEQMTGYSMEEINRLGWYQMLYPDLEYRERARERMDRMREGEDLRFERWEIQTADGAERAIAISTSVLEAADGSVHVLGLMHDLTEHEELKREAHLARTDELTSVKNRRGFEEEARLLLRLARRQQQCITVGFLDISGFKKLNDDRGHQEGDRALRAIGETLSGSVRSTDVVGRIGGDEFAVVLPHTDAAGAKILFRAVEERLRDVVRNHEWEIGFCVGVATFSGEVPELSEALETADSLMYRAKGVETGGVIFESFAGPELPL